MERENLKTKEYFDDYLDTKKVEIEEYIELLSDKEVLPERLYLIRDNIFEEKMHILIAKYSRV